MNSSSAATTGSWKPKSHERRVEFLRDAMAWPDAGRVAAHSRASDAAIPQAGLAFAAGRNLALHRPTQPRRAKLRGGLLRARRLSGNQRGAFAGRSRAASNHRYDDERLPGQFARNSRYRWSINQ